MQPFGQVPAYEEGDLTLFETGAIVLHIGERCPTLLPRDPAQRARAHTWMFAALNSVEPHVQNLATIDLFFPNEEWAKVRRPGAEKLAQARIDAVAASLAGRDYLEGEFTAGDLLMVTVLRFLRHTRMVSRQSGAGRLPGAVRGAACLPACLGCATGAVPALRTGSLTFARRAPHQPARPTFFSCFIVRVR